MGFYPKAVCYNARKDNTIQYSTNNTITHITHSNIQPLRQPSILMFTKKIKTTIYTLLRFRNE